MVRTDEGMTDFIDFRDGYYARAAFADDIHALVENAKENLANVDFDTMVGTGLSGATLIPILAREMGKRWVIVRKGEQTHSSVQVMGSLGRKYIFVDDMVSSGRTRQKTLEVIRNIASERAFTTEYIGTYTYRYGNGSWRDSPGGM